MRNPSTESNDRVAQPLDAPAADWGRRNAADFSSLLLELARAQRGYFFYSETDRRRRPLAERAHRALLSELNRDLGVTLIIATHDADVASFAKRRILMRDGQIED